MKKTFLIFFLLINVSLFAERYKYEIRMNNSVQPEEIKMLQVRMFEMFDVMPIFNDSTNTFSVETNVDIDQLVFSEKIVNDFGYNVLYFNKILLTPANETTH